MIGWPGSADMAANHPVTPDTLFRLGSVSKGFVALAALQLQEAGRLRLTDAELTYGEPLAGKLGISAGRRGEFVCHPWSIALRSPRAARSEQPWAGGLNPFGIAEPRPIVCVNLGATFLSRSPPGLLEVTAQAQAAARVVRPLPAHSEDEPHRWRLRMGSGRGMGQCPMLV